MFKIMRIAFASILLIISNNVSAEYSFVNSGYLPTARADTVAFYNGGNYIYIFGGRGGDLEGHVIYDDILRYNINSTEVERIGKFPVPVTQGSVGKDTSENFYYFGGQDMLTQTSDIYKFTLEEPSPIHAGNLPLKMYGQSTVSDKNGNIYIIGGMTDDYKHLNTIYKYKNGVTKLVGLMEYGLFENAAVVYGDFVVILGGISDEGQSRHKLSLFHPGNETVENINTNMTTGLTHSCVVLEDNFLYAFGGISEPGQPEHELSRVDLKTGSTEYLSLGGIGIWRGTSAVYVEKYKRIYVFGGMYWEFDFEYARNSIMYIQL